MPTDIAEPLTATVADALRARLDRAINNALTDKRLVGAVVLLARDGVPIYRRAAGFADREAGISMRQDTIFRLASVTKPIVAAAAMALVEAGNLALEDPVARFIPPFRPRLADGSVPDLSIFHLLTHTAGLAYGFLEPSDGPYHRAKVSDGLDQPGLSMAENLARIAAVPLSSVPGERWAYSVATDVLGEVVARVAGTSLPRAVASLVTDKLAMSDTAFALRDRARLAAAYGTGSPEPIRIGDGEVVAFGPGAGISYAPSRIFDEASFASGGGGMAGTAVDFLAFLEAMRTGGAPVLRSETVARMTRNQIGDLPVDISGPGWGFGLMSAILLDSVEAKVPYAPGTWRWGGAYGHAWFVDPLARLSMVAFTNTAPEGIDGVFTTDVVEAIYASK